MLREQSSHGDRGHKTFGDLVKCYVAGERCGFEENLKTQYKILLISYVKDWGL